MMFILPRKISMTTRARTMGVTTIGKRTSTIDDVHPPKKDKYDYKGKDYGGNDNRKKDKYYRDVHPPKKDKYEDDQSPKYKDDYRKRDKYDYKGKDYRGTDYKKKDKHYRDYSSGGHACLSGESRLKRSQEN